MSYDLFGMTANLIDGCMLIIGKGSKILNARRIKYCFLIDICLLSYWATMDFKRGLYSQGISAIVSIFISIYAFRHWGKKDLE